MPTSTEIREPQTDTRQDDSERTITSGPFIVILYDDDYHTFDEVILQVQKATGYALERAVAITLAADWNGRAIAYEGTKEDCEKVAGVLRQIHLQVETDRAF